MAIPALPSAAPLDKPAPERLTDAGSGLWLDYLASRQSLALRGDAGTAARVDALPRLLQRFFDGRTKPPQLTFAFGPYPEVVDRMIAWAACSSGWDVSRGRARGQPAAAWLKAAAAHENLAPELPPVWQPFGYRVQVGEIERVMICSHAEIDWTRVSPACNAPRIHPKGRYPCGADITFVVRQP